MSGPQRTGRSPFVSNSLVVGPVKISQAILLGAWRKPFGRFGSNHGAKSTARSSTRRELCAGAGSNFRSEYSANNGIARNRRPGSNRSGQGLSGLRHDAAGIARQPAFARNSGNPSEPVRHPATAETSANLGLVANKLGTPRNRFTELITSKRWGFWFLLTAAIIAAALGGLHALEPGHGKTIVAAYLVGSQGTAAQALMLGLIVTATHTAGVYSLGFVTLYASRSIVPDHLYPWLGLISGLVIAGLGIFMLRGRFAGRAHAHHHHHHHHHDDQQHGLIHTHNHSHGGDSHTHHVHEPVPGHGDRCSLEHPAANCSRPHKQSASYRQLLALGITGGIVPCPAALVVLLSAVSLHHIAFGLYLILAFSLGLAAVLISIGLLTVYARRLLARLPADGPLINRWLPVASAAFITLLGTGIAMQALVAMGVLHIQL